MKPAIFIWLVLLIGFLVVEAACPIHLVSIWFAAGALAAMIAAALGAQFWLQITVFVVVSGALLALLWPFIRKFLNPKLQKTNIDAIIGSIGTVTEDIENIDAVGQVKLGAMYWTARTTDGKPLCKGTRVRVDRIEGVKVFVSAVEITAEV